MVGAALQKRGVSVSRGLSAKVRRLLYRPLFGTFVVPKDARVDPALFSEEEFPVFCPKCRYSLRGLRDGLCPECGRPFERGALLVQQYVFGKQLWRLTLLGRVGRWCVVGGLVCVLTFFLGASVLVVLQRLGLVDLEAVSANISVTWTMRLVLAGLLVLAVGYGLILTSALCSLVDAQRSQYRRKRRAVIAALRAAASADEGDSGE